jgi:hypothetical protein
MVVRSQPKQIVHSPSGKNPTQKKTGGVAQVVGPEFKPQHCKNKQTNKQKPAFPEGCFRPVCWKGQKWLMPMAPEGGCWSLSTVMSLAWNPTHRGDTCSCSHSYHHTRLCWLLARSAESTQSSESRTGLFKKQNRNCHKFFHQKNESF